MTLQALLQASYTWADQNAATILAASLLLPIAGTALAWIGKGGRTDRDGRIIASSLIGLAFVLVLLEAAAIFVARSALGASLLDANAMLVLAPILCLAGSVLGVRAVFPLSELGSVRTAADVGAFLLAAAVALWLLSKFRGWGVFFLGSLAQLLLIGALGVFFLWRLYRRAFGRTTRAPLPGSVPDRSVPIRSSAAALGLSVGIVVAALGLLFGLSRLLPAGPAAAVAAPTSTSTAALPADAARPGLANAPGSVAAESAPPRYFTFEDDQGVQQFVDALDKVPERFRAAAREVR